MFQWCPLPSPVDMLFSYNSYGWRGWKLGKRKRFYFSNQSFPYPRTQKNVIFLSSKTFKKKGIGFHTLLCSYVLFHFNSVSLLQLWESYLQRPRDGHMPKEAPIKPNRWTAVRGSQWFSSYLLHANCLLQTLALNDSYASMPLFFPGAAHLPHSYSMCGTKYWINPFVLTEEKDHLTPDG